MIRWWKDTVKVFWPILVTAVVIFVVIRLVRVVWG